MRFTRAGVLETLQRSFVTYQRAMGIPAGLIVWKYVLRNSLISTVTQIGLLFGILLAGAVVIETVFQWPGLGAYAFEADPAVRLRRRDGLHGLCRVRVRHRQPDRRHPPRADRSARDGGMKGTLDILRKLLRDPLGRARAAIILPLVAAAVLAPLLATHPAGACGT